MTKPSSSTNQASAAPAARAFCLASALGIRFTVLMSQRPQRISGVVTTETPLAARASAAARSVALTVMTTAGRTGGLGKAWSRVATPRLTCR